MIGQGDIVRTNCFANLSLSGTLLFPHKFLIFLVITKHRDMRAAEIPAINSSRSVQSDNAAGFHSGYGALLISATRRGLNRCYRYHTAS